MVLVGPDGRDRGRDGPLSDHRLCHGLWVPADGSVRWQAQVKLIDDATPMAQSRDGQRLYVLGVEGRGQGYLDSDWRMQRPSPIAGTAGACTVLGVEGKGQAGVRRVKPESLSRDPSTLWHAAWVDCTTFSCHVLSVTALSLLCAGMLTTFDAHTGETLRSLDMWNRLPPPGNIIHADGLVADFEVGRAAHPLMHGGVATLQVG